jgi:hypothetical protein
MALSEVPFEIVLHPAAGRGLDSLKGARSEGYGPRLLMSKIRSLVRHIVERKKQPMDVPFKSRLGFAQGAQPKTEMFERLLRRQTFRRVWTTISLVNLSLGFSVFGILIVVNRHRADLNGPSDDSFVAAVGGIGGLVIGIGFLVAAYLHGRTMFGPSTAQCTRLDPVFCPGGTG